MIALVSLLFIAMIPIEVCKITNSSLHLLVYFLVTRMTMNFIFVGATPIN